MRRVERRGLVVWLVSMVLVLMVAGCSHAVSVAPPWARANPPAGVTLQDLTSVDDLQQAFDRDAGHPRLVLLVSPT